jgi:hypothetical protein
MLCNVERSHANAQQRQKWRIYREIGGASAITCSGFVGSNARLDLALLRLIVCL